MKIETGVQTHADFSQRRSIRYVRGSVALGAFGVRLCGGGGESYRQWSTTIDPAAWVVDDIPHQMRVGAIVDEWTLVIEVDEGRQVRIPVRGGDFNGFS